MRNLAMLLTLCAAASLPGSSFAASAHNTLGECYDYVVTQFNDAGAQDWDGLEWAMDNCDETYEEMVAEMPIAELRALRKTKIGTLVILAAPDSGSSQSRDGRSSEPRRR
jgi:hypothetical protein